MPLGIQRVANRLPSLWPTWCVVVLIWVSAFLNHPWLYGSLLIAWGVYDLISGRSTFIQAITRSNHPLTYWVIVVTWITLGVGVILYG